MLTSRFLAVLDHIAGMKKDGVEGMEQEREVAEGKKKENTVQRLSIREVAITED